MRVSEAGSRQDNTKDVECVAGERERERGTDGRTENLVNKELSFDYFAFF
jgi:hypothetical protein